MDKSVYVTVNDNKIANIISLSSDFEREWEVKDGAFSVKATVMIISLKRVLTGAADGVRLQSLDNFTLKIKTPHGLSSFTGCRWVAFSETIEQNRIVENIKIAAMGYSLAV